MTEIVYGGELYHFGTKGMKWGVRKYQNEDGSLTPAGEKRYNVQNAKQDYKNAKQDYKSANREYNRSGMTAIGVKRLNDYRSKEAALNNAELNMVNKKAAIANAKKGEKGEINAYARAMGKTGLAGSAYDKASGGRSSRIYDHLIETRGQEFADKVAKKVQTRAITTAAVGVGAAILADAYYIKKTYY